jgi:Fur family transcriptional regulator, ferric uptake regulator
MLGREPKKFRAGDEPRPPDVERLRGQLDTFMAQQGLRSTGQRRVIIDSFLTMTGHATIDDLLEVVRKVDHGIGYATVYRTMKMLTAGGIAHEHKFGNGMTRYELANDASHHDHLICVECGRIQEFEEPLIEELQERVAQRYGFQIIEHKHELYGLCSDHARDSIPVKR